MLEKRLKTRKLVYNCHVLHLETHVLWTCKTILKICADVVVLVRNSFRLKLIASGKVIQDNYSLASQGVRNGQQVMAIVLEDSATDVRAEENNLRELEHVKADTTLLISQSDSYMGVSTFTKDRCEHRYKLAIF